MKQPGFYDVEEYLFRLESTDRNISSSLLTSLSMIITLGRTFTSIAKSSHCVCMASSSSRTICTAVGMKPNLMLHTIACHVTETSWGNALMLFRISCASARVSSQNRKCRRHHSPCFDSILDEAMQCIPWHGALTRAAPAQQLLSRPMVSSPCQTFTAAEDELPVMPGDCNQRLVHTLG